MPPTLDSVDIRWAAVAVACTLFPASVLWVGQVAKGNEEERPLSAVAPAAKAEQAATMALEQRSDGIVVKLSQVNVSQVKSSQADMAPMEVVDVVAWPEPPIKRRAITEGEESEGGVKRRSRGDGENGNGVRRSRG